MADWKREAIRLKLDERLTWGELVERYAPRFPALSLEQVRNKVRDAVRNSPEYRAVQAKSSPPPTAPEHKPANGWKNGVYESDLLVKMTREDGKSPRRMLELHGLDPDEWEVVTVKNNLWNTQVHHSQVDTLGSKLVMYQSKLTAKPITKTVTFADVDAYFAGKEYHTPPPIEPLQYDPDGETLEIDIADLHSGLLAWAKETGASYDLSIMRDCFAHVIADNIARCKGRRFKGIILALLGDLLHVDNDNQTTTKGTFQQAEGRTPKIFTVTLDALIDAVLALGAIAPVDVAYTSGNHDGVSGRMLIKRGHTAMLEHSNIAIRVPEGDMISVMIANTIGRYERATGKPSMIRWSLDRDRYIFSGNVRAWRDLVRASRGDIWFWSNLLFADLPTGRVDLGEFVINAADLKPAERHRHDIITARFVCAEGVSLEMFRHRIAAADYEDFPAVCLSPAQESTRYVDYGGKEMQFVEPWWWGDTTPDMEWARLYYEGMCKLSEEAYMSIRSGKRGLPPQAARAVLTKGVKTEIVLTQTPERWMDWLVLREAKDAHPDMRTCAQLFREAAEAAGLL